MESYFAFIWKKRLNREYLLWGAAVCIAQMAAFKMLYPFPDFFVDSFWYIWAASANMDISIWPIGYSKFLFLFHFLTRSDTALVIFQYSLMQLAAFHFFFTVQYFFITNRWIRNILFIFFFINPLTLYLSNTIASDILFGALTLFWLTELIWILQRPRIYQLFTQSILLFFCFSIRGNAYYYPLVAALTFILSSMSVWRKLAGIVLPFLLLILFTWYSENASYKLTGIRQSSLYIGWQLANNALYIYDHIAVDSTQLPTPEAKDVNRMAERFFAAPTFSLLKPYIDSFPGNFYIVVSVSPLRKYFLQRHKTEKMLFIAQDWGRLSPSFASFGRSIILHHPIEYIRYFIWPNVGNYFMPYLSDLSHYNMGDNQIPLTIQKWFQFPERRVHCFSNDFQRFLGFYNVFFLLLNIYFFGQLFIIILKNRMVQLSKSYRRFYLFTAMYLLINFLFTIVVTVNVLRYQYTPMYILLAVGLLMSESLLNRWPLHWSIKRPTFVNH